MERKEEIRRERRRRSMTGRRRLWVDEAKLNRKKWAYRFANDEGSRIHSMTESDDVWEIAPEGEMAYAGASRSGAPVKAILLRKPKELYDEDKADEQRKIDEIDDASAKPTGEMTYIPSQPGS